MTPITFNLDPKLIEFVKNFAKQEGITQKEVVEMSLETKRKERLRQEIIAEAKEFFEEMSPEMNEECLWLANAGLEDYNKNLKEIENE